MSGLNLTSILSLRAALPGFRDLDTLDRILHVHSLHRMTRSHGIGVRIVECVKVFLRVSSLLSEDINLAFFRRQSRVTDYPLLEGSHCCTTALTAAGPGQ